MPTLGRVGFEQPEDFETGVKKLDPTQDAFLTLAQKGILLAGPPNNNYKGEMPQSLTSLDDERLGDLLNDLARWCGFIEEELAKAINERNAAQHQLEFIEATVRTAIRSDEHARKLTVQDKNDLVACDRRVVDAKSRLLYTETVYALTRTVLNTAQRNWDTASRRITQRGQDIERMKRETSVAGVPSVLATTSRFRRH